jgi:hypothetical protein
MRWLMYDLELTFDYFVTQEGRRTRYRMLTDLAYSLQTNGSSNLLGRTDEQVVNGSRHRKTAVCDANDLYSRVVLWLC